MPLTQRRHSTVAVIGDGFGSLMVCATAVYLGFRSPDITIYGTNPSPIDTYQLGVVDVDGGPSGVSAILAIARLASRAQAGRQDALPPPSQRCTAAGLSPSAPGGPPQWRPARRRG